MRYVKRSDEGEPRSRPTPQLLMSIARSNKVAPDVRPAPQRVQALKCAEGLVDAVEVRADEEVATWF